MPAPLRVGLFQTLEILQRPPMATLYRAKFETTGRPATLKVFKPNTKYVELVRRDIALAAVQRHENISPILDHGDEFGCFYFATPAIEGIRLSDLISELRKLPARPATAGEFLNPLGSWQQVAAGFAKGPLASVTHNLDSFALASLMVEQLAHALEFLNTQGIACANVRPDTCALTPEGRVVLADFTPPLGGDESFVGGDRELVQFLRYLAPEQTENYGESIDPRTHVYSLGAMLYELTTLHYLFENAADPRTLLKSIRNDPPERPNQFAPGIPPACQHAIMKSLSKRKEERFVSALQLGQELKGIVMNQALMPRAAAPLEEPAPAKMNPIEMAKAARAKPPPPPPPKKRVGNVQAKSSGLGKSIAAAILVLGLIVGVMLYIRNKPAGPDSSESVLKTANSVPENETEKTKQEIVSAERQIEQNKSKPAAESKEAMRQHHQAAERAQEQAEAATPDSQQKKPIQEYREFYKKMESEPGVDPELRAACQARIALANYELGEMDNARNAVQQISVRSKDPYEQALYETLNAATGPDREWQLQKQRFGQAMRMWQDQEMSWEMSWFLSIFGDAAMEHNDLELAANLALLKCQFCIDGSDATQLDKALRELQRVARCNFATRSRCETRIGGWLAMLSTQKSDERVKKILARLWVAKATFEASQAMRRLLVAADPVERKYANKSLFAVPELAKASSLLEVRSHVLAEFPDRVKTRLATLTVPDEPQGDWNATLVVSAAVYRTLIEIESGSSIDRSAILLQRAEKHDPSQVALAQAMSGYGLLLNGKFDAALSNLSRSLKEFQSSSNTKAIAALNFLSGVCYAGNRSNALAVEGFASAVDDDKSARTAAILNQIRASEFAGRSVEELIAKLDLGPEQPDSFVSGLSFGFWKRSEWMALGLKELKKTPDANTHAAVHYLAGQNSDAKFAQRHLEQFFMFSCAAAANGEALPKIISSSGKEMLEELSKKLGDTATQKFHSQFFKWYDGGKPQAAQTESARKINAAVRAQQRVTAMKLLVDREKDLSATAQNPAFMEMAGAALKAYETAAQEALNGMPELDQKIAKSRAEKIPE